MQIAPNAIENAERAGIDMALVEDNLRLSYDARAQQHQSALDLALAIERAGREARERPADAAVTAG